ncbi:WxcM-like domain-containing protein [Acetomicrobium sp.]|uniref:WxcM-like domain-containing protein n=1 Tax=Acetomicrobium sp. TaxID=1872099 RepID=UPI002870DD29|nr:WxcM-like domain-containing protein [Acetomicrobium sp.]MDR9768894.1 WxcM-like domain-containing protein [Acetomicrobium sp.]
MSLSKCKIMNLPKISDARGNLTFIRSNKHIPFEIKRVYYFYDVPGGESRGGHAHKNLEQFIIAALVVSMSFWMTVLKEALLS